MTKPETVETTLVAPISASWQATPNDHAPEGAEVMGGVIWKGQIQGKGKAGFQAACNGILGKIKPSFTAALNDCLASCNVVPANYDRPEKWSDVKPANEPAAPETFDDLDAEMQKTMKAGWKDLEKVMSTEDAADAKRRDVAFKNAETIHKVRDQFPGKGDWKRFQKFAPTNELKSFIGKNEIGEAYRSHTIRSVEGFDPDTMLGARVSGNKGVVSAYSSVINLVAHNAVAIFHDDDRRGEYTEADGAATALRDIIAGLMKGGIWYERESEEADGAAAGFLKPTDAQADFADVVIPVHLDNWKADAFAITTNADGAFVAAKTDAGDYVAGTVFGTEGADELVNAVCRALGAYERAAVAAVAKDVTEGLAAEAKAQGAPFAAWPQKLAAEHLGRILFSRIGDDLEAGIADVNAIIDQLVGWADEIADGADIADVIGVEAPESEEEGEDDADAEL